MVALWWADQIASTSWSEGGGDVQAPTRDAALGNAASSRVWPSGHSALDRALPHGGLPRDALVECWLNQASTPAGLEWSVFGHSLGALSIGQGRPLLCILPTGSSRTPTWQPNAAGLQACGLGAAAKLWWVLPGSVGDAAWAAEQGLRARTCAAVLWWLNASNDSPHTLTGTERMHTMRRLNLAAHAGRTPMMVFAPHAGADAASLRLAPSPAPLRLHLRRDSPSPNRCTVEVFKRQGAPLALPLTIQAPLLSEPALMRLRRWHQSTRPTMAQPSTAPTTVPTASALQRSSASARAPAITRSERLALSLWTGASIKPSLVAG